MDIKEYATDVARTCSMTGTGTMDNLHMVLGMVTEVGELADVFKKNLAYQKAIDWVNVQEELGDLMWYIVQFCNFNGYSLENILRMNSAKLHARYPEKFTNDLAINRDLDNESNILKGTSQLSFNDIDEVMERTKNL